MPHDCHGKVVEVGDLVTVTFEVEEVYQGDEYCNCQLKTVLPMYPGNSPTFLTVNTRQVEKQE